MQDNICPFSAPIAQAAFHCEHAQKIIRRGGEEIACQHEMHRDCSSIYQHCKLAALKEMGMEDDLLSVPHATLVKTQFGTLHGLNQSFDKQYQEASTLINETLGHYPTLDDIPVSVTTDASIKHKLQRRKR